MEIEKEQRNEGNQNKGAAMLTVGTKVSARAGVLDSSILNAGYRKQVGRVERVEVKPSGNELVYVRFDDNRVLQFWKHELKSAR
jgi:hypothetical protein